MCGLHVNFKVFLFILYHTIIHGFQVDVLSWLTWATLIFGWQKSPTSGSRKPEASGLAISDLTPGLRSKISTAAPAKPWGLTSPTNIVALRLSG